MRRGWLGVALLLSLGINVGLLAAVAADRWHEPREPVAADGANGGENGQSSAEAPPAGLSTLEISGTGGEEVEIPSPPDGTAPSGPAVAGDAAPGAAGSEMAPDDATTAEPREPSHGEAAGGDPDGEAAGPRVDREPGFAGPMRLVERLTDHLGVEGERRERFVALQRELVATHLEARRERRRLSAALHAELVAAEPDPARLEAITAEMGRVHAAGERRGARLILESRALLDPDQQHAYLGFLERLHGGPAGAHARHLPGRGRGRGHHFRP